MNAIELRIGNLMQDREGRTCKVERLSVDPDENRISAINSAITSLPIQPIPLTEDWLLRLRFTTVIINTWESPEGHYNHYHLINNNGKWIFRGLGASIVEVLHIHQLQNIYFSMTGIELTLKGD